MNAALPPETQAELTATSLELRQLVDVLDAGDDDATVRLGDAIAELGRDDLQALLFVAVFVIYGQRQAQS